MGGDRRGFSLFDPSADLSITERHMPHWFQPGVATFVTFRTADSLPASVLDLWVKKQVDWLSRRSIQVNPLSVRSEFESLRSTVPADVWPALLRFRQQEFHAELDKGHGACRLRNPHLATIVADTLLHFDHVRYEMDCFVVMPNHVHLLAMFYEEWPVNRQAFSWLHYSATAINRAIGSGGTFWQSEPFDHLVRSEAQFRYLRNYICENPRKAGLSEGEFLYWQAE